MNITTLLNEMKLNEGYFFSSKYKDKEKILEAAESVIDGLFSEEFAKDIKFGLSRTKFRNMSTREAKELPTTVGYSNSVDVDHWEKMVSPFKDKEEFKKQVEKKRNALYKFATRNLDRQKIYFNKNLWNSKDMNETRKLLLAIHEMIHTIQPYTSRLKKVEQDIYDILRRGWKPENEEFSLSRVLLGEKNNDAVDRLSEVFTYIVSDRINTEFLTKKGTEELIKYLKNCGLLNKNDPLGFWKFKFSEMREDNKAGQNEHN